MSRITAKSILDKIVFMEAGRNNVEPQYFFSINGDKTLTAQTSEVIEANLLERKSKNSAIIDDQDKYINNLFEDGSLHYFLESANSGFNTSRIERNTRLQFIKKVLNRLIRFNIRQQVHFNYSITNAINIIVEKLKKLSDGYISEQASLKKKITELEYAIEEVRKIQQRQRDNIVDSLRKEYLERISNLEKLIYKADEDQQRWIEELKQERERRIQDLKVENEYILQQLKGEQEQIIQGLKDEQDNTIQELRAECEHKLQELYEKYSHNVQVLKLKQNNDGLSEWVKLLDKRMQGLNDWLSLVSKRVESHEALYDNLRKELFFEINNKHNTEKNDKSIEPYIVNQKEYNKKLSKMNGAIRVQLGAGMLGNENYINVDLRELPEIDVVADVRDLPFEENSVAEIYAAHLIEHFTWMELKNVILPHWYSLLKKEGKIRILTPNIEAMIYQFVNKEVDFNTFSEVVFGGQEYKENYHYVMFNIDRIKDLFTTVGFSKVNIIADARQNGKCLEMEIEAIK